MEVRVRQLIGLIDDEYVISINNKEYFDRKNIPDEVLEMVACNIVGYENDWGTPCFDIYTK
jgi:hypothetical protein